MKIVVLGSKGMSVVGGAGGIERAVEEITLRLASPGHQERGRCFAIRNDRGITVRDARSRAMLDWDAVAGELLHLYCSDLTPFPVAL